MKYVKKPVVIEAFRLLRDAMPEWFTDAISSGIVEPSVNWRGVRIKTLGGVMVAHEGDWIIKGVKGEIYPCKDEIFKMSYDEVGSGYLS